MRTKAARLMPIVFGALVLSKAAAVEASEPAALQVEESKEDYRLSVPLGGLVLTIPKGELKKATSKENRSPRYFLFEDHANGVVVSGWLESAAGFVGAEKFWENETRAWSKRGLPDPQEVTFTKVGAWDAIVYDMRAPGAASSHVRAHWVDAGTWIDVHLSTTTKRPSAESRASLLRMLDAFRVEQKG